MKIIYGRAGTGKSEYIFDDIKKNEAQKIYIITPEQFSFSAEKRLLDTLDNDATTKVEVLSFERMAYNVMKEMCPMDKQKIEKSGKSMLIYEAIIKNQKQLNFLGKSLENVDMILTQITEFKKHNISVEALRKQIEMTDDKYLKMKLNDMCIIYSELESNIADFQDENDVLTVLAENIEASHLFDNAVFYIDEFAGFTKQEYYVIQKLNSIAKEVYITVCTDELVITKSPDADVFYDNKQTVQSLCNLDESLEKDRQIKLEKNYRFKNTELEHLEKNLYSIPYNIYNKNVENIEVYLAENQYAELEHVATNIVKLVRNENYRYKDIAIITKNIDQYSSLCKAIFEEYDIPIFIDEKKELEQNIFIKYVLSILDIFSTNWSYEAVFNYLKTGIVKIENIYELENYCLKWGIKGKKWYDTPWSYEKNVSAFKINEDGESSYEKINNFNEEQTKISLPLLELKNKLAGRKTAKEISEAIYEFLNKNIDINNEEDESIVECWNIIIELLDEIKMLFNDQQMTFDEFSKILKTGLATKEMGQIPQTQDKVIIGDVNRTRTHKVRAVFIIGVNDGAFPSTSSSEGFFDDKDRESLKKEGFELAKGTIEKTYEENFNIYKAFTLAEEKLYISYPSADTEGSALRKSLLISRIHKIFPELKEKSDEKDEVLTTKVTFSKLLDNLTNPEWFEVYKWYQENYPEKLQQAMDGLEFTNEPQKLKSENIDKLYGTKLTTSISKLESYRKCPYSYYLKYDLKLSDKEKLDIKPIDTGSFMHEVIDRFFKQVENVKEIEEEEMKKIIEQIIDEELSSYGKFTLTAKYRTLVQRLKKIMNISMKYIIESLKNSEFEVLGTEVAFGENVEYPPIELTMDDGKKISLIGKIDRIDIAKLPDGKYMRIIDYKSSSQDFDLNKVVAGLQIQLITYVDAVCHNENVMPAGALYYALIEPELRKSVRDLTKEEIEEQIRQKYKMDGIVLADVNVIKAMDTKLETGASDVIPVTLNSDSKINLSKSKTVTREEFENLQKYATNIIKKISGEILSGNIELRPSYNSKTKSTPCQYCEYKSICQFNPKFKNNNYRFVAHKKQQEVLDEIN